MINSLRKFFQEELFSTLKGQIMIGAFSLSALFIFIFASVGRNGILYSLGRAFLGASISTFIVFIAYNILDNIISPIFFPKKNEEKENRSDENGTAEDLYAPPESNLKDSDNISGLDNPESPENMDIDGSFNTINTSERLDNSEDVDYYEKSASNEDNDANDTIDSIISPNSKPSAAAGAASENKSQYTHIGKTGVEIPNSPEIIAKAVRSMRAREEEDKG